MSVHFINTKVNIFVRMKISRLAENCKEECRQKQWTRKSERERDRKRDPRMGWISRERATTDNEKGY